MALVITEEQQMLKTSAKELLKEKSSIVRLRALRDNKDPIGFEQALWKEMAEMGWTALTIPEAYGGLGFWIYRTGAGFGRNGSHVNGFPVDFYHFIEQHGHQPRWKPAAKRSVTP